MTSSEQERRLGKYIIQSELGRGGFATVYQAHDTVLRRDVALKLLHPPLLTDPAFVTRFENDARATAQLDHPRIATIYELGHHEGRLYMAVQLLAGGSLADRIKAHGRLGFSEVVRVVDDIAEALDYAHAAGFTHRDVKPGNILFNRRGDAILTDFGLVKAAESSVIARTTIGGLIGTPAYMAPEIWEGRNDGPGADIYALGCVLFEMLTGELLFTGATPPAMMLAHFQPHRYPEHWPDGTPAGIEAVLERALARDLATRYASAGAFAADLRALATPPPAPAEQVVQVRRQDANLVAPSPSQPEAVPQSVEPGPAAPAAQVLARPSDKVVLAGATPQAAPLGAGADQAARPAQPQPPDAALEPTAQAGRSVRWLVGIVSAGWVAACIASVVLAWALEGDQSSGNIGTIIGWAAGWAGAGLLAGWVMRLGARVARRRQILWLAIGWPFCMTVALFFAVLAYGARPSTGIANLALGAAAAGAVAGMAIRALGQRLSVGQLILLALSWGGGWQLAEILQNDGSGGGPWHGVLYKLSNGGSFHLVFATYSQLKPGYLVIGGILGSALGMVLIWQFGRLATQAASSREIPMAAGRHGQGDVERAAAQDRQARASETSEPRAQEQAPVIPAAVAPASEAPEPAPPAAQTAESKPQRRAVVSSALVLVPLAIAINIAGGQLTKVLQLPFSLDTVGTVLVGALLGPWIGAITGILGHASWTLFGLDQYAVWFAPVAGVTGLLAGAASRLGLFRYAAPRWLSALVCGISGFALMLFVFMFLNSTSTGSERPAWPIAGDLVTKYWLVFLIALALGLAAGYWVLRNAGYVGVIGLLTGVVTSIVVGLIWARLFGGEVAAITGSLLFGREAIVEPFDKLLSFLIVYLIVRFFPQRLIMYFPNMRPSPDSGLEG